MKLEKENIMRSIWKFLRLYKFNQGVLGIGIFTWQVVFWITCLYVVFIILLLIRLLKIKRL